MDEQLLSKRVGGHSEFVSFVACNEYSLHAPAARNE
jgi:hypothetical protein